MDPGSTLTNLIVPQNTGNVLRRTLAHGVTCNNIIRTTFLSPGQLFSLPEKPKLTFNAQNSSKLHIKFSYYFTESTVYPNYKERSINAEYEKSGRLSSESKHTVWAKYSYLMLEEVIAVL